MFNFCFLFLFFVLDFGGGALNESSEREVLPSWITEESGYKNPKKMDSVGMGQGSFEAKGQGSKGWVVVLNEKRGYGIKIELSNSSLDSVSGDFLLIMPWPLTKFNRLKLFTGKFDGTTVQIANTKSFFVLFHASSVSSKMDLKYRRYGNSLEVDPPSTETPVKKNTVFEVQLKGKPPKDYSDERFVQKIKEAMKAIASRYCRTHNIPFYDIPSEQMVRIRRISFCPFEWPERDICSSIEHSIFVSGEVLLEDHLVRDYELTSEHLRDMWSEGNFPQLEELGVDVFILPGMPSTILWWVLITGLIVTSSLIGSFFFWKAGRHIEQAGPRKNSVIFEEVKKKPKLKLGKLQRIPSFMRDSKKLKHPLEGQEEEEALSRRQGGVPRKVQFENTSKSESPKEVPIKNFYGSFLFGTNTAFENDEGNTAHEA